MPASIAPALACLRRGWDSVTAARQLRSGLWTELACAGIPLGWLILALLVSALALALLGTGRRGASYLDWARSCAVVGLAPIVLAMLAMAVGG